MFSSNRNRTYFKKAHKKRFINVSSWLLITLFAFNIHSYADPLNFLAGWGDFESDWNNDGLADSWFTWSAPPPGFTPTLDTSIYKSGHSSQKVDINLNSVDARESFKFLITMDTSRASSFLKPGSRFTFSFWMRTDSVTNSSLKVYAEYGNPNGGDVYYFRNQSPLETLPNWTQYSYTFQIPKNTTYVNFNFRFSPTSPGQTNAHVWLDDVRITDGRPDLVIKHSTIHNYALYPYFMNINTDTMAERFEGGRFNQDAPQAVYLSYHPNGLYTQMIRITYSAQDAKISTPDNPFTLAEITAHPLWRTKTIDGGWVNDGSSFGMDIGNAEYTQAWLQRTLAYVSRMKCKWVFFDAIDVHANHILDNQITQQYGTNNAAWQAAVTQFLTTVCTALHAVNVKVVINLAHISWYDEPGNAWLNIADGSLYELGVVDSDGITANYDPYIPSWQGKFKSMTAKPNKVYIICNRTPLNDARARRFAIATYLLGMNSNSYFSLCTDNDFQIWHPDLGVDLGNPIQDAGNINNLIVTGTWAAGALFKRDFDNGLVLVNPTDSLTFTYNLTTAYNDLDGNSVGPGVVTIAPKNSLILQKASSLNMTLTASPLNPKPGDLVTYTLVCKNCGKQAANSPVITLPLPSQVSLVMGSVNANGTFDPATNTVFWRPASVAADAVLNLTCQGRVK